MSRTDLVHRAVLPPMVMARHDTAWTVGTSMGFWPMSKTTSPSAGTQRPFSVTRASRTLAWGLLALVLVCTGLLALVLVCTACTPQVASDKNSSQQTQQTAPQEIQEPNSPEETMESEPIPPEYPDVADQPREFLTLIEHAPYLSIIDERVRLQFTLTDRFSKTDGMELLQPALSADFCFENQDERLVVCGHSFDLDSPDIEQLGSGQDERPEMLFDNTFLVALSEQLTSPERREETLDPAPIPERHLRHIGLSGGVVTRLKPCTSEPDTVCDLYLLSRKPDLVYALVLLFGPDQEDAPELFALQRLIVQRIRLLPPLPEETKPIE